VLVAACVPSPPASVAPTPIAAPGWIEHEIPASHVALSLPPEWLALDADDLLDPEIRGGLERDFVGARGLLAAVAAQGSRVRLAFIGVDPSSRGLDELSATVAIVAVEPRIPAIGLSVGAGFVLSALEDALTLETPIERKRIDLPVGDAVRFSFEHRVLDPGGGPGVRAALTGALVTTDQASFLVLRNIDTRAGSGAPSLAAVLATLRVLP
jgi:hypothetical protein